MGPETTCTSNDTTEKRKFYMAMELSQKEWKLGFSVGPGQAHGRWRHVAASASGGMPHRGATRTPPRLGRAGAGGVVAKHPRSAAEGVASPKPVQTLCFTSNQWNSPVGVSHSTRAASTWEPRGPRSTAWANSSSAARSPSASASTWS